MFCQFVYFFKKPAFSFVDLILLLFYLDVSAHVFSILFIFSRNQLLAWLMFAMVSFVSSAFISALILKISFLLLTLGFFKKSAFNDSLLYVRHYTDSFIHIIEFNHKVLPREHTGYSKHPLPTTEETALHMDITRWPLLKSYWLNSFQPKIEKFYTVSKNRTRSWLWLRSWILYCQIQT